MKKYFILSGLILRDNNRGTAALGYGAFSFLLEKGYVSETQEVLILAPRKNFLRKDRIEEKDIQGKTWKLHTVFIPSFEAKLAEKYNLCIPFSKLWRSMRKVSLVAAINGGDGFSDIYGTFLFHYRLPDSLYAMCNNVPLIQLPQTFGPFSETKNYKLARKVLQYSEKVYVRDRKYIDELKKMGVEYKESKDLSAYMKPEKWDIDLTPGGIGLNVSGLAYSNTFRTLTGQFGLYPELINELIKYFQTKNKPIYLIPHSYNYTYPEESNDDIVACRLAYNRLTDKKNVTVVDYDMTPPQIKYVISKMAFFCGTRMHANFAAIYSNVPVFGLAYSYKFEGSFSSNGLDGKKQTALINNISKEDITKIISKIDVFYNESVENENKKNSPFTV